jgi:UDP-N-acetylmuramate dehydrogenase
MIPVMPTLRDFLEKINIKAEILYDEPMSAHTTFRIGGPADALVAPAGRTDLLALLEAARREGIPCFVLGGGANVVVADRGIRGIVVDTRLLCGIEEEGSGEGLLLVAGAGTVVDRLVEAAADRELAGLETFYGMPGSVGGAVFMNARCYEVEMVDRLAWVEHAPRDGSPVARSALDPAEWSYKRSPFQDGGPCAGHIVLAAAFRLPAGDPGELRRAMAGKRADREAKGHYRLPSAGSVFKNDRRLGKPTGKILDELGMRGRRVGGAMVSEWHANIFVNAGGATAADLRALIELAQREARERLGAELEPEVLFVGDFQGD